MSEGVTSTAQARLQKLRQEAFQPRMLGFALLKMWIYAVFFTPSIRNSAYIGSHVIDFGDASRIVLLASLFLGAVFFNTTLHKMARSPACFVPALAAAVGVAVLPLGNAGMLPELVVFALSAVLTGVGSGLLDLGWGAVYGKTSGFIAATETALAICIAALFLPLFSGVPFPLQIVIGCLMPFASALVLNKETLTPDGNGKPRDCSPAASLGTASDDRRRTANRMLAKVCISSIVYGFVLQFCWEAYRSQTPALSGMAPGVFIALCAFAAAVIVISDLTFRRKLTLTFSYRPVFLSLVASSLMFMLTGSHSIVPDVCSCIGFILFSILNWTLLADLVSRASLNPYKAFGIGHGCCYVGRILGNLLALTLHAHDLISMDVLMPITAAVIMALAVTYTYTLTEKDILLFENAEPISHADEESPSSQPAAPKVSLSFGEKCRMLAEQNGLSERQVEVMLLFAKGRSRKRIEQELYISAGTVNSHLRNIYSKLGVHSRQELLDHIEDVEAKAI